MAYQYVSEKLTPVQIPHFHPYTFWKPVYADDNINVSFNNKSTPLFKVDIQKDYYFIFAALKTANNIMKVHVCVGNSILLSFKVEFDFRTMSDTRKLIETGNDNFANMFFTLSHYPLLKVKPTLTQMLAIRTKFHYAVTFKFNAAYIEELYRHILITVNFLVDEGSVSTVTSKYYTIYLIDNADIAFEKQVNHDSDLGSRLALFVKFTHHKNIVVLASMQKNSIYFVYNLYNICGIIEADLIKNQVSHIRSRKKELDVAVITDPVDMNTAFFGEFNRYFADSLVSYPSEHFIAFAEQYGLDIDNVSAHDCLTLVDMATV